MAAPDVGVMKRHIIASVILLISFSEVEAPNAVPAPPMAAQVSIPAVSDPAVYADDPRLAELGEWALRRFDNAGLEVPAIEIHLHAAGDSCGGHRGFFNPDLMRIDVCVPELRVILHEIAHAWAHDNVDAEARAAYVEYRGLESWNDPDTSWLERGSEDAANTVAWALQDPPLNGFTPDGPIARNHRAYRLLTGSEVPTTDDGVVGRAVDTVGS